MKPYQSNQTIPEQHTGKARNQELRKAAILDTAHLFRRVPV